MSTHSSPLLRSRSIPGVVYNVGGAALPLKQAQQSSHSQSQSQHHSPVAAAAAGSPRANAAPRSAPPKAGRQKSHTGAAKKQQREVNMDHVKLLFGSIDVLSLGYITRFQFEETLADAGISLKYDARLAEVRRRLDVTLEQAAAEAKQAKAEGTASAGKGGKQSNGFTAPGKDVLFPSSPPAPPLPAPSSSGSAAHPSLPAFPPCPPGLDRFDLSRFAYIVAPSFSLIERSLKRHLVIPDWEAFTAVLKGIYEEVWAETQEGGPAGKSKGKVADYIPELALASPSWFGMSFCSIDGQQYSLGDSGREFSVQSSSKPISYLLALDELGEEAVHRYVGREPSGRNFNDICLNPEAIPHNPMVNSGAIMTCSLIGHGGEQSARFRKIMAKWGEISGSPPERPGGEGAGAVGSSSSSSRGGGSGSGSGGNGGAVQGGKKYITFSNSTYLSERATADRNFCLGYMMQEHDSFNLGSTRLRHLPGRAWGANDLVKNLELYFQCCSIQTSAEGQAIIAATLASGGRCALTNQRCFSEAHVRNCLSLMLSCGMYDYSGEWAYKIGLPAKSGVSGCLMVVIPNVGGLSIYSPPLDALGNSVRGIEFCKKLMDRCSFSAFGASSNSATCGPAGAGQGSAAAGGAAAAAAVGPGPPPPRKLNPVQPKNAQWQTDLIVLCTLCARGDLTGIRAALSAGADPDGRDYDGRTPLHLAASEGQLAAVKYLLLAHPQLKLNPVDRWGNTPFSDAVREGHAEVAEYLYTKMRQQNITPVATAMHQPQPQQQPRQQQPPPPQAQMQGDGRVGS